MPKYRSEEEMLEILKGMKLQPNSQGALTTREAAQVLTWRMREEEQSDTEYTEMAVRRRVKTHALEPLGGWKKNNRYNTYKMEDVFNLPLYPARGSGQKIRERKRKPKEPILSESQSLPENGSIKY